VDQRGAERQQRHVVVGRAADAGVLQRAAVTGPRPRAIAAGNQLPRRSAGRKPTTSTPRRTVPPACRASSKRTACRKTACH
jgi:hypothetical protein